jgi:tetratricopeptide (TPR) repeat protein
MPTTPTITRDAALEAHVIWHKFRREIIAGIFVVVLLIIVAAAYWFYTQRQESAASDLLATAKNAQGYEQVIKQFPNTAASASAYLLLAEAQRNDGKFIEANKTLQAFLNKHPKHELASAAEFAIATNLESLGKKDEALAMYRQTAAKYPSSFSAPLALISGVRLLKEKKQINDARLLCETIINQYPTSRWRFAAEEELSSLKPVEPPVGTPPQTGQGAPTTSPLPVRPPMAPPSGPPAAAAPSVPATAKPTP